MTPWLFLCLRGPQEKQVSRPGSPGLSQAPSAGRPGPAACRALQAASWIARLEAGQPGRKAAACTGAPRLGGRTPCAAASPAAAVPAPPSPPHSRQPPGPRPARRLPASGRARPAASPAGGAEAPGRSAIRRGRARRRAASR